MSISTMYQYILFDLDGTLTDSKEGIMNCFKYAVEKLGDVAPPDETLLTFIGPPLKQSFAKIGYNEEKTEKAIARYRERYETIGKYENAPVPGGVGLMTVTMLIDNTIDAFLKQNGLENEF